MLEGTSNILTKERYYYTARPQENMLWCEEVTSPGSVLFAALMGNSGFQAVVCPTAAVHPFEDITDKIISVRHKLMAKRWRELRLTLAYLLFSAWEVPKASTSFSPLGLLYAHKPRGLLDIVEETWEEQHCPHRTLIQNVMIRERVAAVYPIFYTNRNVLSPIPLTNVIQHEMHVTWQNHKSASLQSSWSTESKHKGRGKENEIKWVSQGFTHIQWHMWMTSLTVWAQLTLELIKVYWLP